MKYMIIIYCNDRKEGLKTPDEFKKWLAEENVKAKAGIPNVEKCSIMVIPQ